MKKEIKYRNLNWEYEFTSETITVRRSSRWIGEEIKFLTIYTIDGNKIISYEYPKYINDDEETIMSSIKPHIDEYIIKKRKDKLKKLNDE